MGGSELYPAGRLFVGTLAVLSMGGVVLSGCGAASPSAPSIGVGTCLTGNQSVEVVRCDSDDAVLRVTQEAAVDPADLLSDEPLAPGDSLYNCPEGHEPIEISQRDFTNPANNSYEGAWCVVALSDGAS